MTSGATAVLLLADLQPAAWAWWRLVRGPGALKGTPGLEFCKVLGSGFEGGFGLRPSLTRQGLFGLFSTASAAQAFLRCSPLVTAYRSHAREWCSVLLQPYACKGQWAGVSLPLSADPPTTGPVAALTRASIAPLKAAAFWRHTPDSQRSLAAAQGCRIAVGLGEAPLLRQATFSIWDDVQAMHAYARQGAHQAAIEASRREGYFTESMFVRFVPTQLQGRWMGRQLG